MEPVRSVMYLDFDNVFSALAKLDPKAAMSFAEQPQTWLRQLAMGEPGESSRRWLVLRCYMNPAGWIPHPDNTGTRLYFSKFRPPFTDAGFEVVDCPRLSHTKNGADIRLVIDAVEALRADVRYEEFVIASGDSDMTPLIVRLRAADRRTTLLSPSDSAVVLGAVADRLIGGEELLELLEVPPNDELDDDDLEAAATEDRAGRPEADAGGPVLNEAEAKARFAELVRDRYAQATEPINLASLAHEVRGELGAVTATSRWFGHGGFSRALQALNLPGVKMAQHSLWDSGRHTPPVQVQPETPEALPPDAVKRVGGVLKLPMLPAESWPQIYEALAAFVAAYEFNLTEATRWARDRLVEEGVKANRHAISTVAHGAAYGGCPIYRQPPPSAEEIGTAFVENVLNRADAADIELAPHEVEAVRAWFAASGSA